MQPRLWAGLLVAAASPTAVQPSTPGAPASVVRRMLLVSPAIMRTSEMGSVASSSHGARLGMARTAASKAGASRRPRSVRSSGRIPKVTENEPSSPGNTRQE